LVHSWLKKKKTIFNCGSVYCEIFKCAVKNNWIQIATNVKCEFENFQVQSWRVLLLLSCFWRITIFITLEHKIIVKWLLSCMTDNVILYLNKKSLKKKVLFFFSVSYEPNDNFRYIVGFRKGNLTRPGLKNYMFHLKKYILGLSSSAWKTISLIFLLIEIE
jgi:hypothetical protein